MFASIYSMLASTICRIGRPQDGSEVINWFVDSPRECRFRHADTHSVFTSLYALDKDD